MAGRLTEPRRSTSRNASSVCSRSSQIPFGDRGATILHAQQARSGTTSGSNGRCLIKMMLRPICVDDASPPFSCRSSLRVSGPIARPGCWPPNCVSGIHLSIPLRNRTSRTVGAWSTLPVDDKPVIAFPDQDDGYPPAASTRAWIGPHVRHQLTSWSKQWHRRSAACYGNKPGRLRLAALTDYGGPAVS